jgi:hypothetical protein
MSHLVKIQTEIRDRVAVESACNRLRWEPPIEGKHTVFSTQVEGLGVKAPKWVYPIVCNLQSGQLHYDNYNGRWGDGVELDRFKQAYAVEKATIEARRQGRSVTEQKLQDGTIQLTIEMESLA